MEANNVKAMREALEFIKLASDDYETYGNTKAGALDVIYEKACAALSAPAEERECSTQKSENCVGNARAARHKCPTALLSLDEAIAHAEDCADDTPCGMNHRQLADWLRELRSLRHCNAAAMREALKIAHNYFERGGTLRSDAARAVEAALSAPPRNCDLHNDGFDAADAYEKATGTIVGSSRQQRSGKEKLMENNVQKMRDALVWLRKTGYRSPEGGWMCITLKMTQKDGKPYPIEVPPYAEDVINAALSAPPRNCDVGTAEEQDARFVKWRYSNPLRAELGLDALAWAQMPYEEGGKR